MTFLGAPMIYYGTEAGMWGPDDPSDRMPMVWEDLLPYEDPQVEFREELFDHYQHLVAIRHALPQLRRGYFRSILADDSQDVYGFERWLGDRHAYVVLNRSDRKATVTLDLESDHGALVDVLSATSSELVENGPDARPLLKRKPNAESLGVSEGQVRVTLPPYGSAVLIPDKQLP
jgi:hypothetical protein